MASVVNKAANHLRIISSLWQESKMMALFHTIHAVKLAFLYPRDKLRRYASVRRFKSFVGDRDEFTLNIQYSDSVSSQIVLPAVDSGLSLDLFENGIREPTETRLILEQLDEGIETVLDLGANLGYFALMEAHKVKKVYAVEPNPNSAKFLKKSIALNKFDNVEVLNLAIGDKKGYRKFILAEKWNLSRFADLPTHMRRDTDKVIEVEVDTLDNLFGDTKIDLIRMDVEGAELQIIRNMDRLIKNNPRIMIAMELHLFTLEQRLEFQAWLSNSGFRIKFGSSCTKQNTNEVICDMDPRKLMDGPPCSHVILQKP